MRCRIGLLLTLSLAACGGGVDPEPARPTDQPVADAATPVSDAAMDAEADAEVLDAGADADPCAAARCTIIDTRTEVGCRVAPGECDYLYEQVCPPFPRPSSFEPLCKASHLPPKLDGGTN